MSAHDEARREFAEKAGAMRRLPEKVSFEDLRFLRGCAKKRYFSARERQRIDGLVRKVTG